MATENQVKTSEGDEPAKGRMILRLFGFVMPYKWLILVAIAAMAATAACLGFQASLIVPLINKGMFGEARQGIFKHVSGGGQTETAPAAETAPTEGGVGGQAVHSWEEIRRIGLLLVLVGLLAGLLTFAEQYIANRAIMLSVVDIRNAICKALLPQPLAYFNERRSGEFISRVNNDVNYTENALRFLCTDLFLEPFKLLAMLGLALYFCWQLALPLAAGLALLALPLRLLAKRVRKAGRRGLQCLADLTEAMQQMFQGIRIVKAFRMEGAEAERFRQMNRGFFHQVMRMWVARGLSKSTTETVSGVSAGLFVIAGGWFVFKAGWLNLGQLFLFVFCAIQMYAAVKRLAKGYNELHQSLAGAERVFELLDQKPAIQDAPDAAALPRLRRGISFRNVSFAYYDEPVLRDINLEVRCGETVAVVGKSGAGKSTLMDLIPRFYDPTAGSIEFDGVDLRRVKRDSLLDQIAIVTQQTFLFNRSVAENIRYGRPAASDAEARAAAAAANADDFIRAMPNGYETFVGEFGVRLSGGQRQRLAIARAILKNAPILILDEAMVGLDSESETVVREAIVRLMQGRTTFLIAHDFSTIQHADRIIVLKDGRLVETGTHDDLVARGGEYSRLWLLHGANG